MEAHYIFTQGLVDYLRQRAVESDKYVSGGL